MKINGIEYKKSFVKIPAGVIMMRDDRIKKVWKVEIKSFEIMKYQVTNALYNKIMNIEDDKNLNYPKESIS